MISIKSQPRYLLIILVLIVTLFSACKPIEEDEPEAFLDEILPKATTEMAPEAPATLEVLTERPSPIQLIDPNNMFDYAIRSFIQVPEGLTWGPDGYLYLADGAGHHVVKVGKDGSMDDLGLWKMVTTLQQDGPKGIVFDSRGNQYIHNHSTILLRDTSGNVEVLTGVNGSPIGSIVVSQSDELYYTDRGDSGRLLKWIPDGSSEVIVSGLPQAENLVFGLDGMLYLTQMGHPDLLKVNVDIGEVEVFATGVCGPDPCYLAIDLEGDIWVRGLSSLYQFTPTGKQKPFVVDGETYPSGHYNWDTSAGIAIDDEGGVWVASTGSKLMRLVPINPGTPDPEFTMEIISPGIQASDIAVDSNGLIYAADMNTGQVLKINPGSDAKSLVSLESLGSMAIAVDKNNAVYLAKPQGEIVVVEEDSSLIHYATVSTRRMVFGANDVLYAVSGNFGQPKSIVSITGIDMVETLVNQIDGIPLGNGETTISPALDQGLYVYVEWDRNLFFVNFEGQGHLIANLSDLSGGAPAAMAASPVSGDIYFIPHGPYTLFRIDSQGNHQLLSNNGFVDPTGMVVSQDGKYLYVAESGAIGIIPLSEISP